MRYRDPELSVNEQPGEISAAAISKVQDILLSQFKDKSKVENWFGRFITDYLNENDHADESSLTRDEFLSEFQRLGYLRRPAGTRANYLVNQDGLIELFINGNRVKHSQDIDELVKLFCNQHIIEYKNVKPLLRAHGSLEFLCELYNSGYVEFSNE
jgi:50S ribosomal protein L16 3-hydroxylase